MDSVGVLASTAERSPLVDVEPFAADKKVLANFFWAAPHETKVIALAVFAAGVLSKPTVLQLFQLVFAVQVVAKASTAPENLS